MTPRGEQKPYSIAWGNTMSDTFDEIIVDGWHTSLVAVQRHFEETNAAVGAQVRVRGSYDDPVFFVTLERLDEHGSALLVEPE